MSGPQFGDVSHAALRARFPALKRLGETLRPREIPYVAMATLNDCAAACLAMVLGFFGRETRLEDVRSAMGVGRGGATASAILATASLYELQGRGIRIDLEELHKLPAGTILHWSLKHFVVLEKADDRAVVIVDPGTGRRAVPMEEASKHFTGVALLFEKGDKFESTKERDKPLRRYVLRAFRASNEWTRIVVSSLLLQLFACAAPFISGRLIDRVIPRADYELLLVLMSSFAFVVAFQFMTQMIRGHLLLHLRTRIDASMTLGFLEHMLRLPYAFFQSRQTADLLIRVNSISAIRDVMTSSVLSAMLDGSLVFGYLALLVALSPKLAAVSLGVVLVLAIAYLGTRKRMRELAAANVARQTEASSYLTEVLAGIESLKAIGCESRASQRWAGLYVDLLNNGLERGALSTWTDTLLSTIRTISPFLILMVGVTDVMSDRLTLGSMMTANSFAVAFITPVANLLVNYAQLQMVAVQLARVEDVLHAMPEQFSDPPRPLQIATHLTGAIEVKGVSFRYAPTLPLVVRDVSLRIEPGQMVALVGPSASGKSTLASLLLGLYEPTAGGVLYDGVDLKDVDLRSIRRQLGVVVQKSYVFGTSMRANIALGDPDMPLQRVRDAARLACIDEDIESMPMGYDTPVIAGGGSISGGQRQRLALARALAHDPRILLLDEATSALDSKTEERVHRNIEGLGCTRILVAHRLSTVVNADVILVVKDGAVVEAGTHHELLAVRGVYADLVRAQDIVQSERREWRRELDAESERTLVTAAPVFDNVRDGPWRAGA
jgi:ATP-binding cassette, subfamily B, bacterial